jgi:hypothetical protein
MTQLEAYCLLSDAIQSLNFLKGQLEGVKEALGETIDWDALEGTENQPDC